MMNIDKYLDKFIGVLVFDNHKLKKLKLCYEILISLLRK